MAATTQTITSTLTGRSTHATEAKSMKVEVDLAKLLDDEGELGGDGNGKVAITFSWAAQHTVSWDTAMVWEGATLDAGSCNLYAFPAFVLSQQETLNNGRQASVRTVGASWGTQILTGRRLQFLCKL